MRFAWLLALAACTPPPATPPPAAPAPASAPTEETVTAVSTTLPSEPSPIDESHEPKGHLATAVIQRVVRASMPKITACYERALAKNPSEPGGKVRVRFVIARDGRVASVANTLEKPAANTTLGAALDDDRTPLLSDRAVVACVLGEFKQLTFPAPEGGIVVLTYPLTFSAQ